MARKDDWLAAHLATVPGDQTSVRLTFAEVDRLVGGLPRRGARCGSGGRTVLTGRRWLGGEAGWHVETVEFAERWVRFARGRVGGTRADRLAAARPTAPVTTPASTPPTALSPAGSVTPEAAYDTAPVEARSAVRLDQVADEVAVSVRYSWKHPGAVTLDADDKVAFPRPLPQAPGLDRMHFDSAEPGQLDRFYFGETDNLRRRLGSNYRNPGPSQQTSLRVNEALRTHLAGGGRVTLAVALTVELSERDSDTEALNLTRKAGRLLAESAALVLAHHVSVQLENLG